MNLLNLLPWRRARIQKITELLDPSPYINAFYAEGDIINATWKIVKVGGRLRCVPWERK